MKLRLAPKTKDPLLFVLFALCFALFVPPLFAQDDADTLTSDDCMGCHDVDEAGHEYTAMVEGSMHAGFGCLDCHAEMDVFPHPEELSLSPGLDSCGMCHFEAAEVYTKHGRGVVGENPDVPSCASCHGSHDIKAANAPNSPTHPANMADTCAVCHADQELIDKYDIFISNAMELYEQSAHGQATAGGIPFAASCNDCHGVGGSGHEILGPADPRSSINYLNIPGTCGECHDTIEVEYVESIHGVAAMRGERASPVCTDCHGEHGIVSPQDPRSPLYRTRLAIESCAPCHESARLNEKYGLATGRLASFIDSYHGTKTMAGDTRVANCASCHGVHDIKSSDDPLSRVYPDNLVATCGECHPGISPQLAAQPIHGIGGEGLHTGVAGWVRLIYIVLIVGTIGFMTFHWGIDFWRVMKKHLARRPQVRRMQRHEVWQHHMLAVTFIALVISGFALRFSEGFLAQTLFGWDGGFYWRGVVHRFAAVLFTLTAIYHMFYLAFTARGRQFFVDMLPRWRDAKELKQKMAYNLGFEDKHPRFGRFSYVEKIEYWALIWGSVVMFVTGVLLWFDNWFVQYMPKGVLDVALVIHYWEAWLATLAIIIWHFYATIYNPEVYPMNPAWLTGMMPEDMYKHEHPEHFEEAKKETERELEEHDELIHGKDHDEGSERPQES